MVWRRGPGGVRERGMHTEDHPGTWEALPFPRERYRRDEDNEARRDERQGVGGSHSTDEGGEPT